MDKFTRRGFVGVLAGTAASALWMPRARAVERIRVQGRWTANVAGSQLRLSLWAKLDGSSETREAPPRAIELRSRLDLDGARIVMELEPSPMPLRVRRTRSGRRIERRIFLAEQEVNYDTFTATLPPRLRGVRGTGQLAIEASVRGALDDYAERHRAVVAALGRLRATIPVRLA